MNINAVAVELDIAAHGLTFGVLTAIGSAIGAGSIFLFGEQMARAKIVGLSLGGYRVSIGPNESLNFPFILIDRALLYYSYIANWAHGRRDYPESQGVKTHGTDEKMGYTAKWSMKEKRTCRSFFKALQKKDDFQKETTRKFMIDLFDISQDIEPGAGRQIDVEQDQIEIGLMLGNILGGLLPVLEPMKREFMRIEQVYYRI